MESKGISIILYPRSYNKRGHNSLHSVLGVTPDGQEVNVKLRIEEKHQGQDYTPSIVEFAREDRKALSACIATADNGPEKREGILLFTQAIPDSKSSNSQNTYIAKWASVLAEDADSPEPFFGFARMQIAKNSSAISKLKAKLVEAKKSGASTSEILVLESRLQDTRNFSYPAIFYYPEQGSEIKDSDREGLFKALSQASAMNSRNNLLGGCMLRWVDSQKRVDPSRCVEVFPRFIGAKNSFESAVTFAKRIIRDYGSSLLLGGGGIEIIPLVRINTGTVSSAHYGTQRRYETVNRLYYDELGTPLICRASARISYYEHNGRTYLSRLYALTEPLGDPRRLSLDGLFTKLFIGEKPKINVELSGDGVCSEIPAGLSLYRDGTNLSIDFFFSKDRYLAAVESIFGVEDVSPNVSNEDDLIIGRGDCLHDASENSIINNAPEERNSIKSEVALISEQLTISENTENQIDAVSDPAFGEESQVNLSKDTKLKESPREVAENHVGEGNTESNSSIDWLSDIDNEVIEIPELSESSATEEDDFFEDLPLEENSIEPPTPGRGMSHGLEPLEEINKKDNIVEKKPPQHLNPKSKSGDSDSNGTSGGLASFLNL